MITTPVAVLFIITSIIQLVAIFVLAINCNDLHRRVLELEYPRERK